MFKRLHHIQIATVLEALDADLLAAHHCFFGGGTAIVLSHDEYRESIDIDFLVSDRAGYRALRQLMKSQSGINAIVRKGVKLALAHEVRADQYGIRTMLAIGKNEIKFEIVLEGRIEIEQPKASDCICGIHTLTALDMATTKLLANSDRWADDGVFSRDLIDLAMLNLPGRLWTQALEKAQAAYGKSIQRDLTHAIKQLMGRPGRLEECMAALKIDDFPAALLWKHIRRLRPKST